MKISIQQNILKQTLKNVMRTISKKPHLPILNGILFEVKKDLNLMSITSTDLLVGSKFNIEVSVDEDIEFIVPGKILGDIVNVLDGDETTLLIDGKNLQIINGKDKVGIQLLSEGDYPEFPLLNGESCKIKETALRKIVKSVGFAASTDLSRPILTGLYYFFGDEHKVVGTDGFRLSVLTLKNTTDWQDRGWIISAKAFADVLSLVENYNNKEIEFIVDEERGQVNFSSANFVYFAKLIDGNYPPFEKIIPLEFATEVCFSKENLINDLSKALVLTRDASSIIKMLFNEDGIFLSGKSSSGSTYEGVVPIDKFEGETTEIAFNAHYILDFLNTVKSDVVWMGINDKTKPAMFKDVQDKELIYIAMPFKAR
ncbi:MAG: DNA polymerase III subunit beta [Pseudomonadales bacterium]|jgi:DNA polymerase-3 subunit beta|nr:DNA polymerase III subunit beta [Pseudomonadales bacterium]